jgi:hypothetical protein
VTNLAARLSETVRQYAEIGAHHRTGTAEDARTLDWFEDRVRALGATTERQPWSFDRYDAEWRVTVDGAEVEALPLYYEGTGEIDSTAPVVAAVSAGAFPTWPAIVADARSAGAPVAVVATRSLRDDVVVVVGEETRRRQREDHQLDPGRAEQLRLVVDVLVAAR